MGAVTGSGNSPFFIAEQLLRDRAVNKKTPGWSVTPMSRSAVARRVCVVCGKATEGRRSYCSESCIQRAKRDRARAGLSRGVPVVEPLPRAAFGSEDGAQEKAIRAELVRVGREDTWMGQLALALARQVDSGAGGPQVIGGLARQLENTMRTALLGADQPGDPVDDLKERRRARHHGA